MACPMASGRLILRETRQAGFADPAEILQNSAVMYACGHTFTAEEVQAWLDRQRSRYRQYGFGLRAIQLKASGRMIGQAGLTMQAYRDTQALEIGYLLKKRFWHRGYAVETAAACRQYAFAHLHAERVFSIHQARQRPVCPGGRIHRHAKGG